MDEIASVSTFTQERPAKALSLVPLLIALTPDEERKFFGHPAPRWADMGFEAYAQPSMGGASDAWSLFLEKANPQVIVTGWTTPKLPMAWLARNDCPLRYVCHLTGSVRHVVPREFLLQGGLVTNWGDLASKAVAEHALLLALSALRNQAKWPTVLFADKFIHAPTHLQTRTLHGRRVGLHGFGAVAQALLPLLRPFETDIYAYTAGLPATMIEKAGAKPCASLQELCSKSDVLFECESLTPATTGILGARELAALPDAAVLVNIGRGAVVDEPAMVAEAATGRIRLALDVANQEPPVGQHPLRQIGDLVWSPHIAGPTFDQYRQCGKRALANLQRYITGEPLQSVVTLPIYDRST